ncbi:uncharacterized protein [Dermacentor albipictus]|uniref:uncharacterized protein isoform X2 n=1 Tax=Dermacentor albipictus TaxID=60249 RepID=UPI0031FBCB6D
MDFFTPLGLDQEEQESDEEARRHRRELSRARRLSMQHQAEGKVEKSATPEAGAVPRRRSGSVAATGSRRSYDVPGVVDDKIPALERRRPRESLVPCSPSEAPDSSDQNAPSGKHSACQMGSLSSASSPGAASATKKRGSLLKRLSNAILTKAKREQSAAAQHSSPVERGAPPNDDLREGSPPRGAGH